MSGNNYWQEDEDVDYCQECEEEFTFLNRRHHCRICCRIFCDSCCPVRSGGSRSLDGQRACNPCWENALQRAARSRHATELRLKRRDNVGQANAFTANMERDVSESRPAGAASRKVNQHASPDRDAVSAASGVAESEDDSEASDSGDDDGDGSNAETSSHVDGLDNDSSVRDAGQRSQQQDFASRRATQRPAPAGLADANLLRGMHLERHGIPAANVEVVLESLLRKVHRQASALQIVAREGFAAKAQASALRARLASSTGGHTDADKDRLATGVHDRTKRVASSLGRPPKGSSIKSVPLADHHHVAGQKDGYFQDVYTGFQRGRGDHRCTPEVEATFTDGPTGLVLAPALTYMRLLSKAMGIKDTTLASTAAPSSSTAINGLSSPSQPLPPFRRASGAGSTSAASVDPWGGIGSGNGVDGRSSPVSARYRRDSGSTNGDGSTVAGIGEGQSGKQVLRSRYGMTVSGGSGNGAGAAGASSLRPTAGRPGSQRGGTAPAPPRGPMSPGSTDTRGFERKMTLARDTSADGAAGRPSAVSSYLDTSALRHAITAAVRIDYESLSSMMSIDPSSPLSAPSRPLPDLMLQAPYSLVIARIQPLVNGDPSPAQQLNSASHHACCEWLRPGLMLTHINGVHLAGVPPAKAMDVYNRAQRPVALRFLYHPLAVVQQHQAGIATRLQTVCAHADSMASTVSVAIAASSSASKQYKAQLSAVSKGYSQQRAKIGALMNDLSERDALVTELRAQIRDLETRLEYLSSLRPLGGGISAAATSTRLVSTARQALKSVKLPASAPGADDEANDAAKSEIAATAAGVNAAAAGSFSSLVSAVASSAHTAASKAGGSAPTSSNAVVAADPLYPTAVSELNEETAPLAAKASDVTANASETALLQQLHAISKTNTSVGSVINTIVAERKSGKRKGRSAANDEASYRLIAALVQREAASKDATSAMRRIADLEASTADLRGQLTSVSRQLDAEVHKNRTLESMIAEAGVKSPQSSVSGAIDLGSLWSQYRFVQQRLTLMTAAYEKANAESVEYRIRTQELAEECGALRARLGALGHANDDEALAAAAAMASAGSRPSTRLSFHATMAERGSSRADTTGTAAKASSLGIKGPKFKNLVMMALSKSRADKQKGATNAAAPMAQDSVEPEPSSRLFTGIGSAEHSDDDEDNVQIPCAPIGTAGGGSTLNTFILDDHYTGDLGGGGLARTTAALGPASTAARKLSVNDDGDDVYDDDDHHLQGASAGNPFGPPPDDLGTAAIKPGRGGPASIARGRTGSDASIANSVVTTASAAGRSMGGGTAHAFAQAATSTSAGNPFGASPATGPSAASSATSPLQSATAAAASPSDQPIAPGGLTAADIANARLALNPKPLSSSAAVQGEVYCKLLNTGSAARAEGRGEGFVLCSYFHKCSRDPGKKNFGGWTWRYGMVGCGEVAYYKSEFDAKPQGRFALRTVASVAVLSSSQAMGRTFAIQVNLTYGKSYMLSLQGNVERDAWMGLLSAVAAANQADKASAASIVDDGGADAAEAGDYDSFDAGGLGEPRAGPKRLSVKAMATKFKALKVNMSRPRFRSGSVSEVTQPS